MAGNMIDRIANTHFRLAEEIQDASGTLPKAIMWAVALNAVLGYVAVLTLCFTVDDMSSIITSPTGYPFIQHCYNITRSYAGTNVMVSIVIIALVAAVISEVATASRQIWSFARDDGLPFSSFLKRVSSYVRQYIVCVTDVVRSCLAGTFL